MKPCLARRGAAAAVVALLLTFGAAAETKPASGRTPDAQQTPAPYKAIERLIGEWNTGPIDAPPVFVQRLSWGTDRAYIVFRTIFLTDAGEHLHFEGPILWNAATGRFDYLFAIEPGSGALAQEKGEIYVADAEVIIRDVTLTAANGSTSRFRQTFRLIDGDHLETALMREIAGGWTPTFPGSERLIMTRKS